MTDTDDTVIDAMQKTNADEQAGKIPRFLISKPELEYICTSLREEGKNEKLAEYISVHILSQPASADVMSSIQGLISEYGSADGISKLTDRLKSSDISKQSGLKKVMWLAVIGGIGVLLYLFGRSVIDWFNKSNRASEEQVIKRESILSQYYKDHQQQFKDPYAHDSRQPDTKDWWL